MCIGQNVLRSYDPILQNPRQRRRERGRIYALNGHKNLNISKTKADIENFSGVKSVLNLIFFPLENIKESKKKIFGRKFF